MRYAISILMFMTLCTTARAQSVKIYEEKGTDWKKYQTFSVSEGELVTVLKEEVDREKILSEVRKTIASELRSRGLEQVEAGGNLVVLFTAELVETASVQDVGPLGQAPADQPVEMDQSRVWTQVRRQGSLALEVSDRESSKTVWRSSISIEYASDEPAVILNAAVGRSLRKFPVK